MAKIRALVLKSLCETLNKGAYSNLQLKSSLLDDSLTSKDKALYKQLYFGTLERLKTLDAVIAKFSKMKLNKMSPQLKNALRLGAFQILFCERIFDTEAVNITVELIKKKMPSASGFVNAVLRNIQRNKEGLVASLINPCERYSVSESIVDMLKKEYGKEKAYAFMEGLFENIPITAAVNTLKTDAAALSDILEKQDIEAKINNGYLELYAHTSIENTPAYKEGLFHLQGEASQNAIKLLETEPGMTVIDMCSAPGSKSFTAAYIMKNKGQIFAFDLYPHRVKLIEAGAKRLGIEIIKAQDGDSSKALPIDIKADRIICDVPCSGIGMMSKRPEIRYKDITDIKELTDLQYSILCNASNYLKENGLLLYSTCTLNPKENREITDKFLKEYTDFTYIKEPHTDIEPKKEGFFTAVIGRKTNG